MFFSKKSLYSTAKKFNLQISDLTYAFHSIDEAFKHMKKFKLIFESWTKKTKYNKKK